MNPETKVKLSESGQQRRDSMLGSLVDSMDRHHLQRKRRRQMAAGSAALILLAALVGLVLVLQAPNDQSELTDKERPESTINRQPEWAKGPSARTEKYFVKTPNRSELDKYFVPSSSAPDSSMLVTSRETTSALKVNILSDDQLEASYRSIGREGVVAQIGERKVFLTRRKTPKDDSSM